MIIKIFISISSNTTQALAAHFDFTSFLSRPFFFFLVLGRSFFYTQGVLVEICIVLPGHTAWQSVCNLYSWLDAVAIQMNLQHAFVFDQNNVRVPGCFQHLRIEEETDFRQALNRLTKIWGHQAIELLWDHAGGGRREREWKGCQHMNLVHSKASSSKNWTLKNWTLNNIFSK